MRNRLKLKNDWKKTGLFEKRIIKTKLLEIGMT